MGERERRDVEFVSAGTVCRAWLYPPALAEGAGDITKPRPCIVMAHGFGSTRDASIEPFARRFADAGFAALLFDYRHFGASEGQPRQLLSVRRQLADWQAAIDFARTLPGVDPARIALWGTSFSGGHVVKAAVNDGRIAAVTSQCPMMDGVASSLSALRWGGPLSPLRFAFHGLLDFARAALRLEPDLIPIVGAPGTLAAMTAPDAEPGYRVLSPANYVNAVAARIGLVLGFYRPGLSARRLACPILVQICERDTVASPRAAERAAAAAGRWAEVVRYPAGHFDVYKGEAFERSVRDQRAFFERHLCSVPPTERDRP